MVIIFCFVGLERLQDVLQINEPNDYPVTVRQLGPDDNYQPLLKQIEMAGENHIILDCSPEKVMNILKQAIGVKMMEEYQVNNELHKSCFTLISSNSTFFFSLKFLKVRQSSNQEMILI